jgi:hypothetical protein
MIGVEVHRLELQCAYTSYVIKYGEYLGVLTFKGGIVTSRDDISQL